MKKKFLIALVAGAVVLVPIVLLASCAMEFRKHNPALYARKGQWEDFKRAVERHSSWVSRTDVEGRTALFYTNQKDMAELLLVNGADPNARDVYGFTPLHTVYAPSVVKLLLGAGASPDTQSYASKYAPLHCAVNFETLNDFIMEDTWLEDLPKKEDRFVFEEPDISEEDHLLRIRLLLEAGANVNAQASQKETPLDIAGYRAKPLLKEYGAKTVTDGAWEKKFGLKPTPHKGFLDSLQPDSDTGGED